MDSGCAAPAAVTPARSWGGDGSTPGFLTLSIAASTVAGVLALCETRAQGNGYQAQCNVERNRCFVTCERPNAPANCLIACSDVHQICLSGCVPE